MYGRMAHIAVRNTVYKIFYDISKPEKLTNDLTHREKGFIAAIAGACGTLASHVFDKVYIV